MYTQTFVDHIVTNQKRLREISRLTSWDEINELNLCERLKTACKSAWTPGKGLAAIQIGVPLQFAWYRWGEGDYYLINPEIVEFKGKMKALREGCLSIPHNWVKVKRAYKIKYISDGVTLMARADRAHIIQHEVDHMNGILNVDKAV